jgi:hypothetical protein
MAVKRDEAAAPAGETTPQMRLQMMSTEHWSLLASRSLAWTESFSRASMFLSTVSFAVVALALAGQASGFGEEFRLFALVVLPVALFVGIGTAIRMDGANYHEALCVIGMNRIRAGYLELAPDLRPFFVMGTTDDLKGAALTMAIPPGRSMAANIVAGSPTLIAVLNAVLAAAIVALALVQIGVAAGVAITVGMPTFVVALSLQAWVALRSMRGSMMTYQPVFPDPESSSAPSSTHG